MKLTWLRDKLLRSSRPFCFAFLFVFCSKLILFFLVEGDECRQIEFGDALSNSRLSTDHVIRVYLVQNEPSCRVKCFLDPDCVAYNYGKDYEGNLQCELCNKSHLQLPSNHVMVTPGFIFRPVAENPCITNPCPHSFTCQVGFRDQGYRCVSALSADYERRIVFIEPISDKVLLGHVIRREQNHCHSDPCREKNELCQVGFTEKRDRCVCKEGYQGTRCNEDVDECTPNLHNCAPNMTCVNEYGSFFCKECQDALGMENGGVLDEQITASSELNDNSAAYQGRLNAYESAQGSTVKSRAWVAGTSDQSQWLQVDLYDEESLISRVATQGRNQDVSWVLANSQWVERYKLQYSNDGRDFEYYHEQGKSTAKEFTGNTDENSIVFHDLNPPIRARYIRFRPTAWHQCISMRVELYGCCDSLSVIVCDGNTKEIRCESMSKIRILWANYGRLHPKTCTHPSIRTINCRASTSLSNVRNICQDKTACTLRSNSGSFGGDPCGGTYKYLLVGYKCEN
ncbi:EGF-like repeat and discoidin I-like domain-containing protein 3 isoform X1 [Acropora palmata]|uniref:EGF-like repeat and discoidin I-like domain-containing protein 3 isoform X1 n=2 Tax=Acropora palmata TaxID=6131 RepID=UPI003DA1070C